MPLVHGIEIRERLPRYPGEPKYKRLDFIRPKNKELTQEWVLVHSSQPRRAPMYMNGGQFGQQQQIPWPQNPHWQQSQVQWPGQAQSYPPQNWQHNQQLQQRFPQYPPNMQPNIQQIAPHAHNQNGYNQRFQQNQQPYVMQPRMQPRLDQRPANSSGILNLGPVRDSDDDIVEVIEPRRAGSVRFPSQTRMHGRSRSRNRSRSRHRRPTGDSLYSSDSDDDGRGRRRPSGGWDSDSDDDSLIGTFRRSASRSRPRRGW
jgi:hypothetical protein